MDYCIIFSSSKTFFKCNPNTSAQSAQMECCWPGRDLLVTSREPPTEFSHSRPLLASPRPPLLSQSPVILRSGPELKHHKIRGGR